MVWEALSLATLQGLAPSDSVGMTDGSPLAHIRECHYSTGCSVWYPVHRCYAPCTTWGIVPGAVALGLVPACAGFCEPRWPLNEQPPAPLGCIWFLQDVPKNAKWQRASLSGGSNGGDKGDKNPVTTEREGTAKEAIASPALCMAPCCTGCWKGGGDLVPAFREPAVHSVGHSAPTGCPAVAQTFPRRPVSSSQPLGHEPGRKSVGPGG